MQGDSIRLSTTLGRCIFNETLPADFPFINFLVDRRQLTVIVNELAKTYPKVEVAAALDALKDAGFYWATRSGVTIGIEDVVAPPNKARDPGELRAPGRQGAARVRARPDHRRGASSGAHRDLDARDRRRGQGHGGGLPRDQLGLDDGQLRRPW